MCGRCIMTPNIDPQARECVPENDIFSLSGPDTDFLPEPNQITRVIHVYMVLTIMCKWFLPHCWWNASVAATLGAGE
ncbi:hypothetical protein VTK56DRAFT_2882 [Thermocarpiscus australiensis]